MSDSVFIERDSLVAMADAVREATGETKLFTMAEIPDALTRTKSIVERSCTSFIIPNGVTSIGDCAFYGCRKLTDITIPNSVTSINSTAFYGCDGLVDITIPSSIISIGSFAFQNCNNLASVTIINNAMSFGMSPFSGCSKLKIINVPWSEGAVSGAPWGATNATINYNYQNNGGA